MFSNLNRRTVIMVGVALFAAVATALFARGWLNAQRAAIAEAERAGQEVLVVKADLPAGRFIKAQDLRWQLWPKGTLPPTYIVKGAKDKRAPEDFEGAVVRSGMVAGQPVTEMLVVRPGEQGFLAAVLEPGKRAVSIQVNAITGISGFVFPGDRVDMVLTHSIPDVDGKNNRHVSETVLEDIRVLAVDQKTDDQKGKAAVAKTVTFEVTPKQVEKIGIVSQIGRISLSLRPIAREAMPEKPGTANPADVGEAAPPAGPASTAAAAPVEGAVPGRQTVALSIGSAQAAEPRPESVTIAVAGAGAEGAPVPLITIETETAALEPAPGAAQEAPKDVAKAPAGSASPDAPQMAAVPADLVPPRRPVDPVPPQERAGVTLDSEVSRVLGWDRRGTGRVVRVVRGSKAEEETF